MYKHERREISTRRKRVPAFMPKVDSSLWDDMEYYLTKRELSCPTAKFNGWYPSSCAGDNEPRIVMPATNSKGIAYWQARLMRSTEGVFRYQSPSVPRGDSVIQVWPMNKDYMPVLIITEGPMDALASAGCGIPAVALMGLFPSDEAITYIKSLARDVQHVTLFADRDALKEAIDLTKRMGRQGLPVSISDPTPYKDLAAMSTKKRAEILKIYLACTRGSNNQFTIPNKYKVGISN